VAAPALDLQFADLIEHVLACERLERVQDRLDHAAIATHHCHLPSPIGKLFWTCPCGQGWRRELGGGWTTN
jgi:hypothetical protein